MTLHISPEQARRYIALSMFRPDELEKLKNYVTAYMAKHNSGEA